MMKCVMVINEHLPVGLIANTSAVLALTIGDKIKGIIVLFKRNLSGFSGNI